MVYLNSVNWVQVLGIALSAYYHFQVPPIRTQFLIISIALILYLHQKSYI